MPDAADSLAVSIAGELAKAAQWQPPPPVTELLGDSAMEVRPITGRRFHAYQVSFKHFSPPPACGLESMGPG